MPKRAKDPLEGWSCADQLSIDDAPPSQPPTGQGPKRPRGGAPAPMPDYRIGSKGPAHQPGWDEESRYPASLWPISTLSQRRALLERIESDFATGVIDRSAAFSERLHFATRCMEEGL